MHTEYEVRILEIDVDSIKNKLEEVGAKFEWDCLQRRYVYDFIPPQKGRWIRLRYNGFSTTLAIKEIKSLQIDGTNELEIVVSDFDETNRILQKLGYKPRTFQENFRIEYSLNGVNFDIDKWPLIPPYVEIEGTSEHEVLTAANALNIPQTKLTTKDVDSIYNDEYGIVLDTIDMLCFSESELNYIHQFKE